MSTPHFPAELLDHVVDHLHDTKYTLRSCCLVSKSWIPRARKHLFANIRFDDKEDLESWKEIFPDPSISPAGYTKTLIVRCLHVVTAADAEVGGWIGGFSRVVHLKLGHNNTSRVSLLPFRGFSPLIKSLHVEFATLPFSHTLDLILSFPLLEDLSVITSDEVVAEDGDGSDGLPTVIQPSNPPMFTGCLKLETTGLKPITRQLLSLPGGIHFRNFTVMWKHEEDISWTAAFVERCSHTLESLDIACDPYGAVI